MQTPDFDQWANTLWLEQYTSISKTDELEAFKGLTKVIVSKQTKKIEAKANVSVTTDTTTQELLRVYADLTKRTSEESTVPENSVEQQVHST